MKKIFLVIYIGLSLFIFVGCASQNLTESGKKVKLVEPELITDKNCKKATSIVHITEFKIMGTIPAMVISDLKNRVASTGANVGATRFDLRGTYDSKNRAYSIPIGTRIVIDPYSCSPDVWNALVGIE